jgi:hypothetical protein
VGSGDQLPVDAVRVRPTVPIPETIGVPTVEKLSPFAFACSAVKTPKASAKTMIMDNKENVDFICVLHAKMPTVASLVSKCNPGLSPRL